MRAPKRGVAICRRLVEENPASASDRIDAGLRAQRTRLVMRTSPIVPARDGLALEALSILRSLSPEQRETHDAVMAEISDESWLADYDLVSGRPDEALGHARQAVAIGERWVRSGPDVARPSRRFWGCAWLASRLHRAELGPRQGGARGRPARLRDSLEPILRANPRVRVTCRYAEPGSADRGDGRAPARSAGRGVAGRRPSRCAPGRPEPAAAPSRAVLPGRGARVLLRGGPPRRPRAARPIPPDCPRTPTAPSREVREADRLGYRHPGVTAIVNQLLGGRPELQLLLMDQRLPRRPVPARTGLGG